MELVDMQGLKPCPLRGPGSTPGTDIMKGWLFPILVIIITYFFVFIFGCNIVVCNYVYVLDILLRIAYSVVFLHILFLIILYWNTFTLLTMAVKFIFVFFEFFDYLRNYFLFCFYLYTFCCKYYLLRITLVSFKKFIKFF